MSRRDAATRAEKPGPTRPVSGGTAQGSCMVRQADTAPNEHTGTDTTCLMEQVLERENLLAAYQRVARNGGAPGVDGMTVHKLEVHCREHWPRIRDELLSGSYVPEPVRC